MSSSSDLILKNTTEKYLEIFIIRSPLSKIVIPSCYTIKNEYVTRKFNKLALDQTTETFIPDGRYTIS